MKHPRRNYAIRSKLIIWTFHVTLKNYLQAHEIS